MCFSRIATLAALIFACPGCTFDTSGIARRAEDAPAGTTNDDLSVSPPDAADGATADGRPDLPPASSDSAALDGPVKCPPGTTWCAGSSRCADLKKDSTNCGVCGKKCPGAKVCVSGVCCDSGLTNCGGVCIDTTTDASNCGVCNKTCGGACVASVCVTAGCADLGDEQTFTKGMVGCAGKVLFPARATLCGAGHKPCSAQQWVSQRNSTKPTHSYWTNDSLQFNASNRYGKNCYVMLSGGYSCKSPAAPMRVCAGHNDPLGNTCTWDDCGFKTPSPNHHFGGCDGDYTAGTLCCPTSP